jgi:O-antigen/teichoic acid export membrane protein
LRGLLHWPAGVTRQHAGIWRFLLANKLNVSLEELSNRITPLAVGWMLGPAAAGLIQLALKIGMVLAQPVMIIGQTLYPELTQLMADRQHRSVTRVVLRTGSIATGIGLVVLLVLGFFGRDILRFMGGPGFDAAYPVLILIALARTIHLFGFPMASALIAGGNPGKVLKINLLATAFLFPVLLVLLRLLQTEGAGWHALLFAFVTVGLMAAAFVRQNHPGVSGLVNGR